MKSHTLNSLGFTILELMIAIGIASIIVTVLMTISLTYFGDAIRSNQTAELAVSSYYTTRAMIEDLRLGDSIAATNTITDANKSGGWATSDTNNVLVISEPAVDSSNNVIYDPASGYPYENEYIYFVSGTTLYKRTLKNTNAPNNSAKTSCPAATASSSCPVDKTYTTYITDLTFNFYDDTNAATTTPALARSVQLSVALSRKSFGQIISFNNSTQATLRNR